MLMTWLITQQLVRCRFVEGCRLLGGDAGSPDIWLFTLKLLIYVDGESHFKKTYLTDLKAQMAIATNTNQVAKAQGFHVLRLSYKDQADFYEEMKDAVERVLEWDKKREAGTDASPLCIFSKKYCIPDSDSESEEEIGFRVYPYVPPPPPPLPELLGAITLKFLY